MVFWLLAEARTREDTSALVPQEGVRAEERQRVGLSRSPRAHSQPLMSRVVQRSGAYVATPCAYGKLLMSFYYSCF